MGAQCLITHIGISLDLSFLNSLMISYTSSTVVSSRKNDEMMIVHVLPNNLGSSNELCD